MPSDTLFAQRLHECRTAAGLSQRDVSRATNIQPANLCHYEAGTHTPSVENLRAIAGAINASTDYLLGLTASRRCPADDHIRRLRVAAERGGDVQVHSTDLHQVLGDLHAYAETMRVIGSTPSQQ